MEQTHMLPVLFQIGVGFGGFSSMVSNLQNMGFFQLVFPFLLALAIFYGILSMVFKDKMPTSAVGLISLIMSFFVMLFASANPGIVGFLQNVSGGGLIVGAGILFLVVIFGLMGWKVDDFFKPSGGKDLKMIFPLALLAIVIIIVLGAGGGWLLPGVSISGDFMTFIFFIAILVVVLTFLGGGGGGGGGDAHGKKEEHH